MAASIFEYDCEAVRVRATRVTRSSSSGVGVSSRDHEDHRKFSVDPNLTNYDILHSLLMRAFDLPDDEDFVIYFNSAGDWLPLLSDWDLDVAILSAADPCLVLRVVERRMRKVKESSDTESTGASSLIPKLVSSASSSVESVVKSASAYGGGGSGVGVGPSSLSSLRQQVERSLPGLTNRLQRALTMAEDTLLSKGGAAPSPSPSSSMSAAASAAEQQQLQDEARALTDSQFRTYLNKVGEVVLPRELRLAVYHSGVEPTMRKVVWKHLLGVYPHGTTGRQRVDFMKRKVAEYEQLKQIWLTLMLQGRVTDDVKYLMNMVKKDVMRTDRQLSFFSGDANSNVKMLYNILTTYALNHPSVRYCQGMSDLLSPLLMVMLDEGHAYICFCALMSRVKSNFYPDGKTMGLKFEHLSQGLLFYDPEFYAYLKLHQADDLLFCYRWLLLEMKREFSFDDACLALEVLWSSLPPPAAGCGDLRLCEHPFVPKEPPPVAPSGASSSSSSAAKRETVFSNVVTLRKRLSSSDDFPKLSSSASASASPPLQLLRKQQQQRDRIRSAGSAEDKALGGRASPVTAAGKGRAHLKKSKSLLSGRNDAGSKEAAPAAAAAAADNDNEDEREVRKVTDLNDFYRLSPGGGGGVGGESSSATKTAEDRSAESSYVVVGHSSPDGDCEADGDGANDDSSSSAEVIDFFSKTLSLPYNRLPPPTVFGDGNPFLMFMCIAAILQHRDAIMEQQLDFQEIAMYFDRLVRRHDVLRTLRLARKMFAEYLNDEWRRDRPAAAASVSAAADNGQAAGNKC